MESEIKIPNHIAIIMDGNSRWAQARGLSKEQGHKKGAETAKEIIKAAIEFKINHLTLYAFSSENWNRPEEEVSFLMNLLKFYLRVEINNLHKQNIRLKIIGNHASLNSDIQEEIVKAENLTSNNDGLNLNIAFNYGGREEIIQAVKKIIEDKLKTSEIDENLFNKYLYTANIPDPDLVIRTSGEERISNFLLWQSAYAEFFFSPTLWPDYDKNNLNKALTAYNLRNRRYGKR